MPQFFSPVGNDQTFDANGDPLNGGQIETYISGSSTPAGTFTSSNGTTAQPNPIILDSLGYPPSPIWLAGGTAYKFIIKNSMGVTLKTLDGISGINDSTVSVSEWVSSGFVPTYISATSFSVPGDQRSILQVGRRLRTTNTAGIRYSGISVSSFGAGITTVTVINDSGTLDSGLSIVEYGLISATNTSFPFATFSAASTIALTNDGTTNAAHYLTFADGTTGQENLKTDTAKLAYNPSTGELAGVMPIGTVIHVAKNTAPTGFLKANGAAVSRTTYAALFAAISTTFGAGDGSTTFNLPDLRGEFIRGWDDSRGADSGRVFGSAQLDAMQGHIHTTPIYNDAGGAPGARNIGSNTFAGNASSSSPATDGVNGTPRTASETRSRNVALLACIKF